MRCRRRRIVGVCFAGSVIAANSIKNQFPFALFAGMRIIPNIMNSEIQEEVLNIFKESGALLSGHFILRSGLHSANYFQCAQVCQYMDKVSRLVELLLPKLKELGVETVLAPEMGGLVVGQEIARQLGVRFIFAEKEENKLVLRRNFKIAPGEKILVAEDVVTRGGRVIECADIIKAWGGVPVACAMLVDRSAGNATLPRPAVSLLELSFPTYQPDALPPELAAVPAVHPGS